MSTTLFVYVPAKIIAKCERREKAGCTQCRQDVTVERQIRPFAVGRRNFLFTGSVRGGERLALAYTLVDNCKLLGIDPHRYLVDVINKLEAGWPMKRLSELVPWRWAPTRQS